MNREIWIDSYKHHIKGLIIVLLLYITFFLYVLYTLAATPKVALDVLYSNWWIIVIVVILSPLSFWAVYDLLRKEKGTEFKITSLKELKDRKTEFRIFEEKVIASIERILKESQLDFEKIREKKVGFLITSFTIPTHTFRVEPRFTLMGMYKKEVNLLVGPITTKNEKVIENIKRRIDEVFD